MGKETSELLIKALNDYLASSGMSQNALAKAIGVSASALSQYMKKKYPGDVGVLESKISQHLNISQEREEYPKAQIGFVVTSIVQQVTEIARNCHIGQKNGSAKICELLPLINKAGNTDFSAFVLSCKIIVKCSLILKFYGYSRFLVGQELDKGQKA